MKKSRVLARFTREFGSGDLEDTLKRMKSQIQGGDDPKDALVDDLWTACLGDESTALMLRQSDVDRFEFSDIIGELERHGLGGDVRGHYVPASAIAFATTIPYVVSTYRANGNKFTSEDAFKIETYFRRGEMGLLT